jgi:hypothetical protein
MVAGGHGVKTTTSEKFTVLKPQGTYGGGP